MQQSTLVLPLSRPEFKPYIVQALLDWCEDEGFTPYMVAVVDDFTQVPREYVNRDDDSIVLCVSREATHQFQIEPEEIRFHARFGETSHEIIIPMNRVAALFPKENPDLMSYFPVTPTTPGQQQNKAAETNDDEDIPVFTKV